MAQDQDDPRLITRLGGTNMNDVLRYRHQAGAACGTTNKSVRCDLVHEDFGRLIELLTIDEEGQANLLELSMELDMAKRGGENGEDPEVTRQKAIALAKRKLDAAIHLYSEGLIAQDEFVRRREFLEREISHWESWTTKSEQMALELAMCIDAVEKLHFIWEQSNDEDRQGFVRNLFEWVEYDLDARRITNFRRRARASAKSVVRRPSQVRTRAPFADVVERSDWPRQLPPRKRGQVRLRRARRVDADQFAPPARKELEICLLYTSPSPRDS